MDKEFILKLAIPVLCFFTLSPSASVCAFVSQPLAPDEVRIVVYQGVNKAWIEEIFSLNLSSGENKLIFSSENLTGKRLLLTPLCEEVNLEKIENISGGQEISLFAHSPGKYQIILGFFEEGWDWREFYDCIIHKEKNELILYPSILITNQSKRQEKEVSLSWLFGTPLWQEEIPIFATKALGEGMAEEALSGKDSSAPRRERVSEYQLFTFPEKVEISPSTILQFVLPPQTFLFEEIIRFQEGEIYQVLTFENPQNPLPPGVINLFWEDRPPVEELFPGARTGEKAELSISAPPLISIKRKITEYQREEARFSDKKEVVGFISRVKITFEIENQRDEEIHVELIEPVPAPPGGILTAGWEWKDHKAFKKTTLLPAEKKEVVLSYRFEEAVS